MSAELEPMQESIAPFDYSQLDEQTAQALQNYAFRALQVARTYYRDLMEIVVGAHELLCGPVVPNGNNSRHGNRGDDTFRAWCASVRINRTKAYQLLQIHSFMDTCTPEEQSTLALLPFTAMRELVTGDTPEQIITMAKEGKVGTYKEVLELKAQIKAKDKAIAAEKERADAAEAQRDAAQADVAGLYEQNTRLKEQVDAAEAREEEAWSMVSKAQDEAKAAQENLDYEVSQNDALHEEKGQLLRECEAAKQARAEAEARAQEAEKQLAGSRQVAETAKLRGDKLKAENDALKSQPITAVVDKEETRRQAKEMADAMNAELQAKLDAVTGDAEQDARNAYDSVLLASRAMLNTWQMVKPQFRKLPEEQREALANQIVHTIGSIQGEVTKCL